MTADSTVLQDSPSWVYKGEWNGTISQNMFAESRVGQFGYNFGLDSNTRTSRYEDLVTNEVTGGGRDWLNKRRRNQYTGAAQLLQGQLRRRLAQLQVRRRVPWTRAATSSGTSSTPTTSCTSSATASPNSVRLGISGTSSQNALAQTSFFVTDTWRINRLTLNVGARFDRYRVWLPAQEIPVGRFNPVAVPLAGEQRRRAASTTSCRASAPPTTSPATARPC